MAKREPASPIKEAPLSTRIVNEISEKTNDYESKMSNFMSSIVEWAGLFKVLRPPRKANRFSNPRLTEFFRASNTLATLMYRMQTSADPFFSLYAMDPGVDYDKLHTIQRVFETQLQYSKYKPNLLRACLFLVPYGTVIVQEDYRIVGVSPFGRRLPITTFTPRSLDQVAFDRATTDIDEADWLSTADIVSKESLMRLASDSEELGDMTWHPKALRSAAQHVEEANTINQMVRARLVKGGFSIDDAIANRRELLMYYGKLDAMNDNIEYVCAVVNRKHLVRFHANNFQHGKRPFRVAKWIDFDSALGLGLGQLLGPHHKSMDSNRQAAQDNIAMAAWNMWQRKKNSTGEDEFVVRPNQFIDVESINDVQPLPVATKGAEVALLLEDKLKQEFRAASGATDTLQALITEATASEVSLAQNEALRNISVKSELAAEPLVREHLEVMHANNIQNIRSPFNINKAGLARTVYPSDLRVDLDFKPKVTTDRDFKPQRLEKIIQLIQILTSTKSQHPDQLQISIMPLVKEAAAMLDVNPNDVILRPGMQPALPGADLAGLGAATAPGAALPPPGPGLGGPALGAVPAGPTLVSPA